MPMCKKAHRHDTPEGVTRCNQKYADRVVGRIASRPRDPDIPIDHKPARVIPGVIPVAVFRESKNRPIGRTR